MSGHITVIGAGLAGCEAAWQIAKRGVHVTLCEMKPEKRSPAHSSSMFAELVCSNSFKADRLESAAGLMKHEMRMLGSFLLEIADKCRVPAGGALAVDREMFSEMVTDAIKANDFIDVRCGEITEIPEDDAVIIATGPLTSDEFSKAIAELCGTPYLSFYDAAAPIVTADSIDMTKAFAASRYDRGGDDDYINCPMNKAEYDAFVEQLITAERAHQHGVDGDPTVYEGCMPIEIMARRGHDTIRFGPMKPVGLTDPSTGHRPWANLQLRKENSQGTMYNLVGFQTNLKFPEQKRVFGMIPALANAEFARYGVMHRNTFIDSPRLLNADFSMRKNPAVYFAGQISGVEGYMESAASGLLAGINAVARLRGESPFIAHRHTILGSLAAYISDESVVNFQPMGANFGMLEPIEPKIRDKRARYAAMSERAVAALTEDIKTYGGTTL